MTAAETLTRALEGRWQGASGMARCPGHDDATPSLSIADGDEGRLLLKCFAGCAFEHIAEVLKRDGLWPDTGDAPRPDTLRRVSGQARGAPLVRSDRERAASRPADQAERARRAKALWDRARPVTGSPVERYLRGRGITASLPETLRYLGDCPNPTGHRFPAMIARVQIAGSFAVHRTYLRPDGATKADVSPAKAMLGQTRGGAVQLAEGQERLVVAEGLETALSLASGLVRGSVSIWAALSASGLSALHLPSRPGRLLIAADGDATGRNAAEALAHRATADGWEVAIATPPEGQDWNDVLCARAGAS